MSVKLPEIRKSSNNVLFEEMSMSVSDDHTEKKLKSKDQTPKDSADQMKDRRNKSFVLRTLERKMS